MADSDQLSLETPAHHNQQLFSDHYLNVNLPSHAHWRALRSQARKVMEEVAEVLGRFVPSDSERQTEENLVMPVLRLLGHHFEVQPSLKTPEGTY